MKELPTLKTRLPYIDSLKGFAILLVVLGHVLQHYYPDGNFCYRAIYSFHMPLFMFVSGYVSYKAVEWGVVKKRAIQLLIPFFSYIFLKYGMDIVFGDADCSLPVFLLHAILRPDAGLWFLWALFYITILFIACRKISMRIHVKEWIVFLVMAAMLNGIVVLGHVKIFGFHWIAWYFIFYSVGAFWRDCSVRRPNHRNDVAIFVCSFVLFAMMVPFFRMHNEAPTFYQWIDLVPYFPIIYRIVIGFTGIAFCYELFKLYVGNGLYSRALQKLGGGDFRNILYSFSGYKDIVPN